MDAKRQNKLLKLAIGRMQNELEKNENIVNNLGAIQEQTQGGGVANANNGNNVFLTENQM